MSRLRALLAVLAVLVIVAADRVPTVPQDPPRDDRARAVVGLGDSTVAGEGAGAYAPGTRSERGNACHRSANAAIARLTLPGVTAHVNLACSGAGSDDVVLQAGQPSQASRLTAVARHYRVEAVVLAVGANDAPRFADVVLRCIEAWARRSGPPCSQQLAGEWTDRLDAMAPQVERAVTDVRRALRGAGYARQDYDLVLQSYPSPLTERIEPALRDLSGCPLRLEDLTWLRSVAVQQLSTALRGVAERTGARFLDLSRAAEGTRPAQPCPPRSGSPASRSTSSSCAGRTPAFAPSRSPFTRTPPATRRSPRVSARSCGRRSARRRAARTATSCARARSRPQHDGPGGGIADGRDEAVPSTIDDASVLDTLRSVLRSSG